jgi:hypothetical protein
VCRYTAGVLAPGEEIELRVTGKPRDDGALPRANELAVLSLPCDPIVGSVANPPRADVLAELYKANAAAIVTAKVAIQFDSSASVQFARAVERIGTVEQAGEAFKEAAKDARAAEGVARWGCTAAESS